MPNKCRCASGVLGEGKEHLLEAHLADTSQASQLFERACTADDTAGEENEPIAHPFSIHQLVDRENQAAPCCRCLPKNTHNFSGLPQIEPIKGFIHDENGLRRKHAERYQHTAPVTFREMRTARLHHRPQTKSPEGSHLSLFFAPEEAAKHSEQLADTLR